MMPGTSKIRLGPQIDAWDLAWGSFSWFQLAWGRLSWPQLGLATCTCYPQTLKMTSGDLK